MDVRWLLPPSLQPLTSALSGQSYSYLVSVASSDNAAGREWMVAVRNSSTSELRLNLAQSQFEGTPLVTVRRCCVTKSELGEERWRVEQIGKSSTATSAAGGACRDEGRDWMFSRTSFSTNLKLHYIVYEFIDY